MILFRKKSDLAIRRDDLKKNNFKIGLVPTMGALHAGHLSLVKRSIKENDYTIVSIFINPTQFNDKKDLIIYPKNLTKDCQYLDSVSRDIIVFAPEISDIYDKNLSIKKFNFQGLDKFMEGKWHEDVRFNGKGRCRDWWKRRDWTCDGLWYGGSRRFGVDGGKVRGFWRQLSL